MDMRSTLKAFAEEVKKKSASEVPGVFTVSLSGVTFGARQAIIRCMRSDAELRLVRERSNEYDFYAVSVEARVAKNLDDGKPEIWLQIGFLPRPFNVHVAKDLDRGAIVEAALLNVVGDFPTAGVKTEVRKKD